MIYDKEPFVASLWKKGAPVRISASEELVVATDWKDAPSAALLSGRRPSFKRRPGGAHMAILEVRRRE